MFLRTFLFTGKKIILNDFVFSQMNSDKTAVFSFTDVDIFRMRLADIYCITSKHDKPFVSVLQIISKLPHLNSNVQTLT